jgi:hypothetical protein
MPQKVPFHLIEITIFPECVGTKHAYSLGIHVNKRETTFWPVNWSARKPWLNIELDLQSLFGLHLHVHICTHWLRHRNSLPPPRI